jgi:hypothetical protein
VVVALVAVGFLVFGRDGAPATPPEAPPTAEEQPPPESDTGTVSTTIPTDTTPAEEEPQRPPPEREPVPAPDDPQEEPEPRQPEEGDIRALLPDVVAGLNLTSVESLPELIESGAVDAVEAIYRSEGGVEVIHLVVAYATPERAEAVFQGLVDSWTEDGFEPVVEDWEGGRIAHVTTDDDRFIWWSNARLLASAYSLDIETVTQFVNQLPY